MATPDAIDTTLSLAAARETYPDLGAQLIDANYNATITYFERRTDDLWILRIKPDEGTVSFQPGQYASLALGFWEPRVDTALEADIDERWHKLVRRSYSISSPMFNGDDWQGDQTPGRTDDLAGNTDLDEIELYIVLVEPEDDFVPGLTPRLALKKVGDRIFMGRKMAGRYTTAPLTDPTDTAVFLSTGTGEAPQNPMIIELLKRGHTGPIVSIVTARHWSDLAYVDKHRALEARFANYRYLPLPTREPDVPKRYIQDVVREDFTKERLGVELDPASSHVFLCGNPAMIGLPEESSGDTRYPQPTGVVEILTERGFRLDARKEPGTIHVEEYW